MKLDYEFMKRYVNNHKEIFGDTVKPFNDLMDAKISEGKPDAAEKAKKARKSIKEWSDKQ